jgi:hypothetical protein
MACPKWKGLEKCEWFPWRESCVREEVVRGDWKEFNMTVEELTYSYWSCLRDFCLNITSLVITWLSKIATYPTPSFCFLSSVGSTDSMSYDLLCLLFFYFPPFMMT